MEIIKIIAVAVLSCVLVKIIAPYRADLALLVQLGAVIVMLISVSSSLIGLMAQTRKLTAIMSFDSGYLSLLLRALNADPASSPEETVRRVRGAVSEFVGEAEQFDDLTMLCLEYKG